MSRAASVQHRRLRRLPALLLGVAAAGCSAFGPPQPTAHEKLDATLWMRTSAEWGALAQQAYRQGRQQLEVALRPANARWTAALEQTGDYAGLPPAVIMDVDEAILDNSRFGAALVEDQSQFDLRRWKEWVKREEATSVPGAVEFARHAHEKGVRLIYLSNRGYDVEDATRRNLEKAGFPVDPDGTNILSQDERAEWDSRKASRRAYVVREYRVILIVGDDLNDFVSGSKADPASRVEVAQRYASYWGERWILLPNPVYGDWERSLTHFEKNLTRDEVLQHKYEALDDVR